MASRLREELSLARLPLALDSLGFSWLLGLVDLYASLSMGRVWRLLDLDGLRIRLRRGGWKHFLDLESLSQLLSLEPFFDHLAWGCSFELFGFYLLPASRPPQHQDPYRRG